MFRNFINSLDKKYLKVCVYAAGTVIVTLVVLAALYATNGFWGRLWTIFKAVFKPIVIGAIISFLLTPMVDWIQRLFDKKHEKKWARALAIFLSFFIVIAFVVIIFAVLVLTIYKNVSAINMDTVYKLLYLVKDDAQDFYSTIEAQLSSVGFSVSKIGDIFTGVVLSLKSILTGLFFGVIFSIYFMIDTANILSYWKHVVSVLAGERGEAKAEEFFHDVDRAFSGYMRGQFLDAIIVFIVVSIVFFFLGIPDALLIGLLVGIGNLIPYVGPIVGYTSIVVICLPQAAYKELIIGEVALFIITTIDGNVINPRLLSTNIKVHPLLVVAALIGGGAIGGFVGMLVAVPVAALLKQYFDKFLERQEEARAKKETRAEE